MKKLKLRFNRDPILHKRAKKVKRVNQEIVDVISEMKRIMRKYNSPSISAPQIGVLERIIILDMPIYRASPIVGNKMSLETILINPKIIKGKKKDIKEESCSSCPDLVASIERYREIWVTADTIGGWCNISKVFDGRDSRMIQHGIDHLNGITLYDHVVEKQLVLKALQ